jgi:VCBS repeat-containing protein
MIALSWLSIATQKLTVGHETATSFRVESIDFGADHELPL